MHISKKTIYLSILFLFILGIGVFFVWVKAGVVPPDDTQATYVQIGDEVVYATIVDLTAIDATDQSRVYGTEAFFIILADTESAPSLGLMNQPVDIVWIGTRFTVVKTETVTLTQSQQTLSPPNDAQYGLVTHTGAIDDSEKGIGENVQLVTTQ